MPDNSINMLFPSRAVDGLLNLRGEKWDELVGSIMLLEPIDPDRIAFVLLMVRLGGCTSCQSDSFRAMRGCSLCSTTTIKRYKGDDQSLVDQYNEAKIDIKNYMNEV
jgi:hypothetical protein